MEFYALFTHFLGECFKYEVRAQYAVNYKSNIETIYTGLEREIFFL